MGSLYIPEDYCSPLTVAETEEAIKFIKDGFERGLAARLNLKRISAPLFVRPESGLNDNLNGVERPVTFDVAGIGGASVEIVHSLAKWKRMALHKYGFRPDTGLYTDMNAIRRDEELDNIHSIYVDQWDWERVLSPGERTKDFLISIVAQIFEAISETERALCSRFKKLTPFISPVFEAVTTQELEDAYPDLTPKERENEICREHGSVFVMQIGGALRSGKPHDGRAPDYDDWSLNGDILVWYEPLGCALELSSMGIRVDAKSMMSQLKTAGCEERAKLPFHRAVLDGELPLTIGGGIGQSRLCMALLHKAHIGEVQASVWPDDMIKKCSDAGVFLL
jgi:aspartate--ammonia ligase